MDENYFGLMRGPMDEDGFFNPTDLSFLAQPTDQPPAQPVAPVAPTPPPPPAWQPLAQTLTSQWQKFGIDPTMSGVNRAEELARLLTNYGISDLSRLGLKDKSYMQTHTYGGGGGEGDGGQPVEHQIEALGKQLTYGDKAFGYLGGFGSKGQEEFGQEDLLRENNDLVGWSAAGKGNVSYRAVQGSDGQVYIVPQWGSSSDWKDARDMLKMGATFASMMIPGLGGTIGSALLPAGTSAAVSSAVGNAILSGVASGDPKAALAGGLGSLASPYIGKAAQAAGQAVGGDMLGKIVEQAVSGAGRSAVGAAVRGDSIGDALLSGGLGGAAGAVSSGLMDKIDLPEPVERVASTALTNALLGRDVERATVNAIIGEIMRSGSTPSDRPAGESALSQTSFLKPDEILATQLPETISPDIDVVEALLGGIPFSGTDNVLKGTSFVDEGQVLADPASSELSRASFVRPEEVLSDTVAVGGRDQDIVESLIGQDRAGPSALSKTTFIDADKIAADSVSVGDRDADIIESILGQEKAGASELAKTKFLDEEKIATEPIFVGDQDIDLIESILGQTKAGESELSKTKFLNEDDIIENEVAEIIGRRTDEEIAEDILRGIDTDAVGPAPAPPSAPRATAPAPSRPPAPAPAPAPKASSFDPALLALLGAMMTRQEEGKDTYQVADVRGSRSPFGSLLGETGTQDDLLRILRG